MTTYTCDKFRQIKDGHETSDGFVVDDPKGAAMVFANRIAKRIYGRKGYCHHVRLDNAAMDGRYGNYQAFIGVPAQGGGTNGHNVWLTVYIHPAAERGSLAVWT